MSEVTSKCTESNCECIDNNADGLYYMCLEGYLKEDKEESVE